MIMRIKKCKDSQLWYAGMVGQTIKIISSDKLDPDIYWSREDNGYKNIVYKEDIEVVDCLYENAQSVS